MKNYNEIAKSVLSRRDAYEEKKRTKRQNIAQISTAIVCLVAITVAGFTIVRRNWLKNQVKEFLDFQDSLSGSQTDINSTTKVQTTMPTVPPTQGTSPYVTTTEISTETDWNRKSMPGKFCSLGINSSQNLNAIDESDITVGSREYVYPFGPSEEIATLRQGTLLVTDVQIEGREPDGTVHTALVDIFALEGLSEDLALGVRFPEDDRIYTYVCSSYIPATLGEFLDAIDYDNTVTYGGIRLYPGNNFPVNNENAKDIRTYLLSDTSASNITDADAEAVGSCVIASVYCRELGRENKVLRIWENGFITTNLIGYEFTFNVGTEAVASFLKNSYNITFEQINELTTVTENTTEPYTSDTVTTTDEYATQTITTSALSAEPSVAAEVTTTVPELTSAEIDITTTWWCGTKMQ
ncbi:MAG: hypothetical protein J6Q79_09645 [Clostridia bacterium]|nr:hypothetical protein [Clostridia bacterium]